MNPLQTVRKVVRHAVPSEFNDILGLSKRLIRSKHGAGRAAMLYSAWGLLATPLDLAMRGAERAKYNKAGSPRHPLIFVIGAPRSGTTLVAQSLIKTLPVRYFNNLTSIFPSSPITALKMFSWTYVKDKRYVKASSLYGRTVRLSEPNDALYFWDRWMDKNRKKIPESFSSRQQRLIRRFFGAFEEHQGGPLLQKVNRMNTFAHLVADTLPTAKFVCLDRNPVFHAQSLLMARRFIHGDEGKSYGIQGDKPEDLLPTDKPIESICRQVIFHKNLIQKQKKAIGSDRFIHLPYESFCQSPENWITEISERFLGYGLEADVLKKNMPKIRLSTKIKINKVELDQILKTFRCLKKKSEIASDLISDSELTLSQNH